VERSSSQILFNYLPGKTFDHESYRVVCKVERVEGDQLDEIDRATIVDRVNSRLDASKAGGNNIVNFDERTRRSAASWTIKRPTQVVARVFPLLLQCRLGCKRLYELKDDGSSAKLRQCPTCNKRLSQVQQILFHECGTLRSLEVPSCPRHGRGDIALEDRGSLSTTDWRWVCRAKGCNQTIIRPMTKRCDCGTHPNSMLRTDIYRSNHVFRPHREQIIDFPIKERRLFVEGPSATDATLAAFLGVAEDQIGASENAQSQAEAMRTLAASLASSNPELAHQLQVELQKPATTEPLSRQVDRYFEETEKERVAVAVRDFVVASRGIGFVPWTELVRDEARRNVIETALRGCGIEALKFSRAFPTSVVVFGYSRGGSDSGEAAVLGFARDGEKHVMFGSENKADAILITLSSQKLLKCIGVEEKDPQRARARVAATVASGEASAETLRGIVHTFAHAFIKATSAWAGLDSTSLAEYLLPAAGAFAVYEIVGTGISMGGMHRMVQRHLLAATLEFNSIVAGCMYDPACLERQGSCFACVHLADISCQEFNNGLDRRLLIGDGGYMREAALPPSA
jgi:hypothetical protein